MFKYLAYTLILCLSLSANAGFRGSDPSVVAETSSINGEVSVFYDTPVNTAMAMKDPLCAARNIMVVHVLRADPIYGCWWMNGERMFAYTDMYGLLLVNLDFVLMNDNYQEDGHRSSLGI